MYKRYAITKIVRERNAMWAHQSSKGLSSLTPQSCKLELVKSCSTESVNPLVRTIGFLGVFFFPVSTFGGLWRDWLGILETTAPKELSMEVCTGAHRHAC